jgi:hypothetical protein
MAIVTYKYAMRDGDLVNIDSVQKQDHPFEYLCLSCGKAMTPVMGNFRARHFRHKVEADCSGETYLHNLAKLVFSKTYKECLDTGKPYLVQYQSTAVCSNCEEDGPCNVGIVLGDYDLTRHFKEMRVEERDNEVVPDILLRSGDNVLYIEIAVTHYCEPAKIALGRPIIELEIKHEDDIGLILSRALPRSDSRIAYHNFRIKGPAGPGRYLERCGKRRSFFALDKSGKCALAEGRQWEYEKLKADYFVKAVESSSVEIFVRCLIEALVAGHQVTDCWICRKHTLHADRRSSYCLATKTRLNTTSYAHTCQAYSKADSAGLLDLLELKLNRLRVPAAAAGYGQEDQEDQGSSFWSRESPWD